MKDMITGKEIIGTSKEVKLYRGDIVASDVKRIGNTTKYTTTYKNFSEFLLIVDNKTYRRAEITSIFSLSRISGWGMLILSVILAGILINIFVSLEIYSTFFICFPWAIPGLSLVFMLFISGKTPEEVLKHRYIKKISLPKGQAILTEEQFLKTKLVR